MGDGGGPRGRAPPERRPRRPAARLRRRRRGGRGRRPGLAGAAGGPRPGLAGRPPRRHRQLRRGPGALRGDGGAAARGAPVAAWMLDPLTGICATAEAGAGAFLGGARLRAGAGCPPPAALRGAVLTRFLPPDLRAAVARRAPAVGAVLPGFACAGREYPAVVAGEQHFALFWRTLAWDHAPGVLFAQEAGAGGAAAGRRPVPRRRRPVGPPGRPERRGMAAGPRHPARRPATGGRGLTRHAAPQMPLPLRPRADATERTAGSECNRRRSVSGALGAGPQEETAPASPPVNATEGFLAF